MTPKFLKYGKAGKHDSATNKYSSLSETLLNLKETVRKLFGNNIKEWEIYQGERL